MYGRSVNRYYGLTEPFDREYEAALVFNAGNRAGDAAHRSGQNANIGARFKIDGERFEPHPFFEQGINLAQFGDEFLLLFYLDDVCDAAGSVEPGLRLTGAGKRLYTRGTAGGPICAACCCPCALSPW